MRSQHFKAVDIIVAADLLRHAGVVLRGLPAEVELLLNAPTVMTAYLSVFTSVVKQAAVMTKAAGGLQSQAQQPPLTTVTSIRQLAALQVQHAAAAVRCFPAVLPVLTQMLAVANMGGATCILPQLRVHHTGIGAHSDTASSSSGRSSSSSSSASSQQCRASAALLAVLVARSLVVLADALEAAAAAAGMTPAQLYARCGDQMSFGDAWRCLAITKTPFYVEQYFTSNRLQCSKCKVVYMLPEQLGCTSHPNIKLTTILQPLLLCVLQVHYVQAVLQVAAGSTQPYRRGVGSCL
jgi:hypothetical protein